ncbi:MAG: M17 family peptidase N-terminal domain-containing protein, partial [Planctomycetota bacterium]
MNFNVVDSKTRLGKTDLLVVFHHERAKSALPAGVEVHATALGDLRGEFRELRLADALAGPAKRVLFVGLGKTAEITSERLRRVAALAVQRADTIGAASATIWCDAELARQAGDEEIAGIALAEGALMGAYRYTRFKSKPRARKL